MLNDELGTNGGEIFFQGIVLSRQAEVVASRGVGLEAKASAIAQLVDQGWRENRPPVQVQFLPDGPGYEGALLYTRRVEDDYLLTLVAPPQTPLSELRVRADAVAARLELGHAGVTQPGVNDSSAWALDSQATPGGQAPMHSAGRNTLALAWRPIGPLPDQLQEPLRQSLERLASAYACLISHLTIQPELVHLLVTCPPDRNTAWAAYLLKEGSEADLQAQFGLSAPLWAKGYYGVESATPLNENELGLFLERVENR
jgi:hypothetical protein